MKNERRETRNENDFSRTSRIAWHRWEACKATCPPSVPRFSSLVSRLSSLAPRLSLLALLAACGKGSGPVSATGTIEYTETDVAPDLGGRLGVLRVHEGDRVAAGDTLAILTAVTMPADLQRQEAVAGDARAQLKDLEAGARPEEIARAEADVRRAESDLALARENRRRIEPLAANGTVPAQRGDEVRAAETQAAERLTTARQALLQLRNGPRPETVAAARARVGQAEAALASLKARAGELVLVAPAAGRVRDTWFEPGELVPVGRPVLTLADDTRPWVRVYVGQSAFASITPGAGATARLDVEGEAITGHVVALSDKAEYTPRVALTETERADLTFWVKVALDDSTGRAKAGLPVTVTFDRPLP
jgi:HlyD family secretion protein